MSTPDPTPHSLHIHLDPVGGAAGDMFVAAMLDAFPILADRVLADIAAILPARIGRAELVSVMASGLRARQFRVRLTEDAKTSRHGADTTYAAMRKTLTDAELSPGTCDAACAILHRIARAEAHVHDVPIEQVHFHEIADWDSLVDVTAAGSIHAALNDASWSVAPLPLGGGLVDTAHGKLPVPAPATTEILTGFAWRDDGIPGERVTPTGAAILALLTGGKTGPRPDGTLCSSGSGAGTRTLEGVPNILRVTVFQTTEGNPVWQQENISHLACDIDDMTGEEIGDAVERLRAADGVLDVVLFSAQGKKSRPATRLELLVRPDCCRRIAADLFNITSTLGIRRSRIERLVLPRVAETGPTGTRRKRTRRPDGTETLKVESDDLASAGNLAARRQRARSAEVD